MKDKWAVADFRLDYMKEGRFDILASSIERCLHSLGIEDLQVTCRTVIKDMLEIRKDRFEITITRKENEENTLKNIYWKHTIKED